jgi:hypothetical protein
VARCNAHSNLRCVARCNAHSNLRCVACCNAHSNLRCVAHCIAHSNLRCVERCNAHSSLRYLARCNAHSNLRTRGSEQADRLLHFPNSDQTALAADLRTDTITTLFAFQPTVPPSRLLSVCSQLQFLKQLTDFHETTYEWYHSSVHPSWQCWMHYSQ